MKKLLILSGKGGTGKTTVAATFIHFAGAEAFADCDVDAPNLHLITEMDTEPERADHTGSEKAHIDNIRCISCGKCADTCRFGAVRYRKGLYQVDEYACEGCAVCTLVCPAQAISLKPDIAGKLELYRGDRVFSTAELKMGRGNSGKLVSEVKDRMIKASEAELAVIDGSPGIGCPVISSVSGVDLALIVTEPTLSGLSDLKRLTATTSAMLTKTAVCVNKYDLCLEKAEMIRSFCEKEKIPFVGYLPYDKRAVEAVNSGESVALTDCPLRDSLKETFRRTMDLLM